MSGDSARSGFFVGYLIFIQKFLPVLPRVTVLFRNISRRHETSIRRQISFTQHGVSILSQRLSKSHLFLLFGHVLVGEIQLQRKSAFATYLTMPRVVIFWFLGFCHTESIAKEVAKSNLTCPPPDECC